VKVVIPGGSGQVGTALKRAFERDGDEVVILSRGSGGDGRQYLSWIHHDDFYAALRFLIEHEELEGAVNLAAPEPLPNAEFMRALGEAWGRGSACRRRSGCSRSAPSSCRDRARAQEPARRAGSPARGGLRVQIPGVAARRPRALRTLASRDWTGLTRAARRIRWRPSAVLVGMRRIRVMGSASKNEVKP
jgi:nucleoside-diphosphate-sugar epimerase